MARIARWTVPLLVALVPLGIVLPTMAQRADAQPRETNHAKEMVMLIQQGQLNLADATRLAEKHAKGTALGASSELRSDAAPGREPGGGGGPAEDQAQSGAKRLIYNITCFANDKLQAVQVDGLTKKVIEPVRPQP
ncbi:MAG TPA: hypothetical protein PKC49_07760 [Phycisphaerae bacterium]|nr:hypothetical protein [Phycisphaerae bacterium]